MSSDSAAKREELQKLKDALAAKVEKQEFLGAGNLKKRIAELEAEIKESDRLAKAGFTPWYVESALLPSEFGECGLWEVVNDSGIGNQVRDGPSTDAAIVGALTHGMRISGCKRSVCGELWLQFAKQLLPPPLGHPLHVEVPGGVGDAWALIDATDMGLKVSGELIRWIGPASTTDAKPSPESPKELKRWRVLRHRVVAQESAQGSCEVLAFQKESFDGYWIDSTGEEIATIRGDAILWSGGASTRIKRLSSGEFESKLWGWGDLTARLDDEGRLCWHDGDVWTRSKLNRLPAASVSRATTVILARHGERLDDAEQMHTGRPWVPTAERPWDPSLTPLGRLQAHRLGLKVLHSCSRLGVAPPSAVFSSPYERCFDTAACAAQAAGVSSISVEPSLSEGLSEEFWRSWAVPGADGTWGGPDGCSMGKRVNRRDLRPEACGRLAEMVPVGRLERCIGHVLAPLDSEYTPFLPFEDIKHTWGNFESEEQLRARMRNFFDHVAEKYAGQTVMLVSHNGPTMALFRSVMPDVVPAPPCDYCACFVLRKKDSQSPWTAEVVPKDVPIFPPLPEEHPALGRGAKRQPGANPRPTKAMLKARTEEWIQMAKEIFDKFDEDKNGYWSLQEASRLFSVTMGVKLTLDMFFTLLTLTRPDGKQLTEAEFERGLSKEQVVKLYTDEKLRQNWYSVLGIRRDHAAVFNKGRAPMSCMQCGSRADEDRPGFGDFEGQWYCKRCWAKWAPDGGTQEEADDHSKVVEKQQPPKTKSVYKGCEDVPSLEEILRKLDEEEAILQAASTQPKEPARRYGGAFSAAARNLQGGQQLRGGGIGGAARPGPAGLKIPANLPGVAGSGSTAAPKFNPVMRIAPSSSTASSAGGPMRFAGVGLRKPRDVD
eukprot:gnl/TRDRNA2_/TRDRNA2_54518_c0_seq1.p1 gnl/TRDRNA2_/TRDRNA2_54518_c0~~gnl/TRDRNA2_/TRDRNA2_54518_c0_seq1.p1  ORF type:complete len:886 (+),score=177.39 gnl/TRDRNA2_/TRDRNA2_54518_c0_seq1:102-2759(+)